MPNLISGSKKNPWRAAVNHKGRYYYLGLFPTKSMAVEAEEELRFKLTGDRKVSHNSHRYGNGYVPPRGRDGKFYGQGGN